MVVLLLIIVALIVVVCWSRESFKFTSKNRPLFGFYRYGYPYTHYGTWYRPQGYYGPSFTGAPYGFGKNMYGGAQQNYSCKQACLSTYKDHCKEGSIHKCDEKLKRCLGLCQTYSYLY